VSLQNLTDGLLLAMIFGIVALARQILDEQWRLTGKIASCAIFLKYLIYGALFSVILIFGSEAPKS
jgi:hypothetical protein